MLTIGSLCFYALLEQALFIAECANLRLIECPYNSPYCNNYTSSALYHRWEDRATGGGGCRITWYRGIAWVSCHSGYPAADITQEVAELFAEIECKPIEETHIAYRSPSVYPMREEVADLDSWINKENR